jgi:RNA polymerase sigma factor (sigma-70 family)
MTRSTSKNRRVQASSGPRPCISERESAEAPPFDFDAFYRAYVKSAKAFARKRGRTLDAEDFVQEAFLRALEDGAITTAASPQTYLHRIVANLIIDDHRKSRVRSRYLDEEADHLSVEDPSETEASVQNRLELRQLCEFLSLLPPPCRKTFSLYYIDGLNHGEISMRLGVTVRTVDRYLNKVRAFLIQKIS